MKRLKQNSQKAWQYNYIEEINHKILVKEERLKKYWNRIKQYKQNRTFQNN